MKEPFKGLIAAAAAAFIGYSGKLLFPFVVLCVVICVDYITGMIRAYYEATLCSKRGFRGIFKKLCYFLVIICGMVCDFLLSKGLSAVGIGTAMEGFVAVLVTVWLTINELLSILENLTLVGVPLPGFLKKTVKRMLVSTERRADPDAEDAEEQKEDPQLPPEQKEEEPRDL